MEFKTIKDRNKYLIENQKEIISLKKAQIKACDPFILNDRIEVKRNTIKAEAGDNENKDTDDVIYRTVVGNSYLWLDSHEDVHMKNCFKASLAQKEASRVSHLHDHIHQITAKVGKFLEVYESDISWSDLGIEKSGKTQALFGYSEIQKEMNESVFKQYKNGDIDQHSVGMRYISVKFALNDKDYPEAYAEWNKVYPMLGNPEKADERGYFYCVYEAGLIEISCVLNGSNELTPTLPVKFEIIESPSNDNLNENKDKIDPTEVSQKLKSSLLLT